MSGMGRMASRAVTVVPHLIVGGVVGAATGFGCGVLVGAVVGIAGSGASSGAEGLSIHFLAFQGYFYGAPVGAAFAAPVYASLRLRRFPSLWTAWKVLTVTTVSGGLVGALLNPVLAGILAIAGFAVGCEVLERRLARLADRRATGVE